MVFAKHIWMKHKHEPVVEGALVCGTLATLKVFVDVCGTYMYHTALAAGHTDSSTWMCFEDCCQHLTVEIQHRLRLRTGSHVFDNKPAVLNYEHSKSNQECVADRQQ